LRYGVEMAIGKIRIRESYVDRESAEHDISELDAIIRNNVTDAEIMLGKKFREVVEEEEEDARGATV